MKTGCRYDPVGDSWMDTAMTGAPPARDAHSAVAAGTKMIVWGGDEGSGKTDTGGIYDPGTNSWTATRLENAPDARSNHKAVWAGTRMIVWGGIDSMATRVNTGGQYRLLSLYVKN
jgi:N-acetylneuraminic acid mutarotase